MHVHALCLDQLRSLFFKCDCGHRFTGYGPITLPLRHYEGLARAFLPVAFLPLLVALSRLCQVSAVYGGL
jgi:hypothetical protein